MSLLKLAIAYIAAYCEKHSRCDGCRLYRDGEGGCTIQNTGLPPQDWDVDYMVKESRK